jgi:alkyldihydroxyacetonephosphate synthase
MTAKSSASSAARRIDGWGFGDQSFPPPAAMLAWLRQRLGVGEAFASFDAAAFKPSAPASLPDLGCAVASESLDRLANARGCGLSDILRLRSGTVRTVPDGVVRPADDAELEHLLAAASEAALRLVLRGGGTSVTGGVNATKDDAPLVVVDLTAFTGLQDLDADSGLATFGAGTLGPALEAALAKHNLTLGHFPQSWELSTLGGWIATRSAGQESLGYGRIESLVAGLDLVAPAGHLHLPSLPASAAGPDLRHLVLGSEGRLGVITRASVRVRQRPEAMRVEALIVGGWEEGTEAARQLLQEGVPLGMLRLSDPPETAVAMTVGLASNRFAPLVRGWLRLRGLEQRGCLMLLGASGSVDSVHTTFERTRSILRRFPNVWLGAGPGHRWLADRFRHPYLRDGLLDHGYATDTFETAAPWSRLPQLYAAVKAAFREMPGEDEKEIPLLCHLSHPYRDGASLYFTFFFRCPQDGDAAVERWAELKRRATDAVCVAGGTLSHHHGVGSWHAPWYPREAGKTGAGLLYRAAQGLDPQSVLNSHVLFDPSDRLEE